MNRQMAEVMQRRGELLGRIAAQREQIAGLGAHWQVPLTLADRGLAALRFLRSRPMLIVGAISMLLIRRRGAAGLIATGWRTWKLYKSAASLLKK
ncbi:MAG: YqjK-like family protein [Nitrosomonadales bacterium]